MSATELLLHQEVQSLYSEHRGWLFGWLRKRTADAFDAADLTQDTFLRVLTARHKGRDADLREPRAYLTTIARRVLLNHYRRLSLESAYLETLAILPETQAPSTEDRFIILEALQEIDVMLDSLRPKARMAFLLAQLEGMTYAQIAEELSTSVRTIKRYMAMAYQECILRIP